MKNILILLVIFCSCNAITKDETESFIPGTYIRSSRHEFGKENDTLIISLQNANARQYRIERKWRYQRVLDGKPIEPEYKITAASGTYSDKEHLLVESTTGLEYSFDIKRNLLFAGTNQYKKIK
jgi:hypothetical protein